jgi:hypothetical protein
VKQRRRVARVEAVDLRHASRLPAATREACP